MRLIRRATFGYPFPEEKDWVLTYEQFYELSLKKKVEDFENTLIKTLEVCWKDRVEEIALFDTGRVDSEHGKGYLIGVRLLEKWNEALTRGPSAKLPEAAEFRKFYGEKSQIRKFPDGSLCEAVMWSEGKVKDDGVLLLIARECLKKHVTPVAIRQRKFAFNNVVTAFEEYDGVVQAFEKISNTLYSFTDLPLTLSSVICTSPYYRRTFPNPPFGRHLFQNSNRSKMFPDHIARTILGLEDNEKKSLPLPFFQPALKVMITMENSNKFGNDPYIIKQFKTGFYIEMAKKLKERNYFAVPTEDGIYVDVNHFSFLLEIGQTREIIISKQLAEQRRFNEIMYEEDHKSLEYKIQHVPKLASQMYNLTMRFPAFSTTCQLMKRFVGSHLLLNNLDPFLMELLVAEVFIRLDATRGHPPRDTFSGFVHVLQMIATHDFVKEPLFIDFGEKFDEEKQKELKKHFINARPALPGMVIFTSDDESGITITSNLELVILSRLIQICRGAFIIVKKFIECSLDATFGDILGQSLEGLDMDMVIQLKYDVVQHPKEYDEYKSNADKIEDDEKKKELPIVDFDVVDLFLKDLKKAFSSIALFFYNPFGGTQIGVAFRPSFLKKNTDFKVNQSVCKKRTANGLKPNLDEVKETIMLLGSGIIKKIKVVKK